LTLLVHFKLTVFLRRLLCQNSLLGEGLHLGA